jgi:glucokinase
MAQLLSDVAGQAGVPADGIAAVGIGVPGRVDDAAGQVTYAPNLPGFNDVPLASLLRTHLGGNPQIVLDNDVNVAVLGEHVYGVGRGLTSMAGVFVGTGIGGGLILGGKLRQGIRHAAAEIGHTTIDLKGPRCACGRRGCVEAMASRTAMERDVRAKIDRGKKSVVLELMKKKGKPRMTSSIIERALREDDKVVRKVFRRAQKYVGILCANLVNTLDVELVLIGGGIAERLGENMVGRIRDVAYRHFFLQEWREQVRIVPTALKEDAAPLGAAWLARQRRVPAPGPEAGVPVH